MLIYKRGFLFEKGNLGGEIEGTKYISSWLVGWLVILVDLIESVINTSYFDSNAFNSS